MIKMAQISIETINDHISMIDFELSGVKRVGALYLIKGDKTCLVDSGVKESAKRVVQALKSENLFPPDMIILTHSHWDHTQGVPTFCHEAEKMGKKITVMASEKAIPNLKDQSWNIVFDEKRKFENVIGVEPLKEGQIIDLGGIELEVIDFSGHCADDIALYDKKNKSIFLGDSLGYKLEHSLFFPPFMPPFWNKDGFYSAAEKLKQIDYEKIFLAHYGYLDGNEAQEFPNDTVTAVETWWNVFAEADKKGKLDDVTYLRENIVKEANIVMPEIEIAKASMRIMLSLMDTGRKIIGKKPIDVGAMQLEGFIGWLQKGYKGATQ
jgi:glyoxylase-like metal-dependent hydrolase (beta-lactamase superfamily II)